jgi:hypothetical protein
MKRTVLPYHIEPQEQSAWCWAAVAASTVRYYDPGNKALTIQCKVADLCLDKKVLPPHVDTCCGAPWDSNLLFELEKALDKVGTNGGRVKSPMAFDDVVAAIDRGHPVAVGVTWQASLARHFAVIRGYCVTDNRRFFAIADPWDFGTMNYHDADEFLKNYLGHRSTWDESYLTKAPLTKAPQTKALSKASVTTAPGGAHGLQRAKVPPGVFDELKKTLKEIARGEQAESQPDGTNFLKDINLDSLTLDQIDASAIYLMDPGNVESGQSLSATEPGGWQFVIPSGGELTAKVLMKNGTPLLTAFGDGRFVHKAEDHIKHYAATDKRIVTGKYECRLVSAPWAYVFGVWFKDLGSTNDFVIAVEPTHQLLNSAREYAPPSFDGALKDALSIGRAMASAQRTEVVA